jgi:hypothetical protein
VAILQSHRIPFGPSVLSVLTLFPTWSAGAAKQLQRQWETDNAESGSPIKIVAVVKRAGAGDNAEEDTVTAKAAARQFKRALFLARDGLIG